MARDFLQLKGLTKTWPGSHGVQALDLSVAEGEFVALLGPSGCGKSTTLRLIAGLETADQGRIMLRGADVTTTPAAERGLSMVFQSYALFPHLNLRENILFGLKVRKLPKSEREARLAEALEITGLKGLERRRPGEISGGQRQRVALARAIVSKHALCLMDEPLSNLDAKLRHSVRRDIKRMAQDLGMTVIYVTHDQTEAMSMADQVVLMRDGRIEQQGSPEALYARPETLFSAGFIGAPPMARIPGAALGPAGSPDRIYGLRAEYLALTEGPGQLRAEVLDCEYLGSETLINLTAPGCEGLSLRRTGRCLMPPGVPVNLGFDPAQLHVFDAHTGRRL